MTSGARSAVWISVAVLAAVRIAHAKPAATAKPAKASKVPAGAITLGPYGYPSTLDQAAFTVTTGGAMMTVEIALTISMPDDTTTRRHYDRHAETSRSFWLDLPAKARVVGFATSRGSARSVAAFEVDGEAWVRFVDHVYGDRDVALARFRYAVDGRARYNLAVSPLAPGTSVVASVRIEMPASTALDIRARFPVAATLTVDGGAATTIALPGDYATAHVPLPKMSAARGSHATVTRAADALDDDLALIAEPTMPARDDDTILAETRTQARASLAALRACFPRPGLMWLVDLTFTVTPDGRASAIVLDQPLGDPVPPDAKVCVDGEMSAWRFTAPATATPVRYRFEVPRL